MPRNRCGSHEDTDGLADCMGRYIEEIEVIEAFNTALLLPMTQAVTIATLPSPSVPCVAAPDATDDMNSPMSFSSL